jgi:hypothetical protein
VLAEHPDPVEHEAEQRPEGETDDVPRDVVGEQRGEAQYVVPVPRTLTTKNSMLSRSMSERRRWRKVQYRLPSQFTMMARQADTSFAISGPSCSSAGLSTVTTRMLNTARSTMKPRPPTMPKRSTSHARTRIRDGGVMELLMVDLLFSRRMARRETFCIFEANAERSWGK